MMRIFFLSIVFFLNYSCSYRTIKKEDTQPVILKVNEKFRINLPEDHRSGYTWQLSDNYNKQLIDYTNAVWEGNTNGIQFYFQAKQKGKTSIIFTSRKYVDTNEVKKFDLEIN